MANTGANIGTFAQGFMSGYNPAADRLDRRRQQVIQNQRQSELDQRNKMLFDAQMKEAERKRNAAQQTNMLIGGMMSGGIPSTGPDGVGQHIPVQQLLSMSPERREQLTGYGFGQADIASLIPAMSAMRQMQAGPKRDIRLVDIEGPQGFGKYAIDADSGKKTFIGSLPGDSTKMETVEIVGPQGFGTYVYDPKNPKNMTFLGGAKPESGGDSFKDERALAKEWQDINKVFKATDLQYNVIKDAGKQGTAVGDLGMIYAIMKMFDPGSVVRESEFGMAQSAAGLPARLEAYVGKLKEGTRLAPETRQEFLTLADELYKSTDKLYGRTLNQYRTIAKDYNFNPERTIFDIKRGGYNEETEKPRSLGDLSEEEVLESMPSMIDDWRRIQETKNNSDPLGLGL